MTWRQLFVVLLAGVASFEIISAWKTDTEYQYRVEMKNGVGLPREYDQTTNMIGVSLRALLTIRPQTENTLRARISKAEYAKIRSFRQDFWTSKNFEGILEFAKFPMSEETFVIKTSDGVVTDLIVNSGVPTWNVNVLKGIVGNLQIIIPGENHTSSLYKTMEDSVGGKCEVVFDIKRRSASDRNTEPELELQHDDGEIIDIRKFKDYCKCEQRPSYYFGNGESLNNWEQCTNGKPNFLSRSSSSHIVVDIKALTIHYVNTEHTVKMSPILQKNQEGLVESRTSLVLEKIAAVSSNSWVMSANRQSVGSLVYSSNNRFAETDDDPLAGRSQIHSDADWEYCDDNKNDKECRWPTPNLDQVRFTPPLPLFDSHGRKLVHQADTNDRSAMYSSIGHATWISQDLENPDVVPDENTLEKFTILVDIIRTMNTREIDGARQYIFKSAAEVGARQSHIATHQRSWLVFRDAVAQAGTRSALLAIKNWITEKTIEGIEAASVVGVLSTTARTITAEYMDDFFEMITMPETADEEFLNSTAIITFAELVRHSLVNEDGVGNNNELFFTSGRGPLKKNPAIFRDYIPYMSEQLKKSIDNNEFARSHVFIRALGNVAHPAILAIFEPYLQGVLPASTFQRLLMVFSMDKLAFTRPRLVRRILYNIYRNTGEADQIRCIAAVILMTTNPPAGMLQRMAEFTNDDRSKLVNAAVKNAIESASKLTTPEYQDLATKARNVLFMLTKESYDGVELVNDFSELNSVLRIHNYAAADDFIAPAFYSSLPTKYGDLNVTKEIGGIIASIHDLYSAWTKYFRTRGTESKENNGRPQFTPDIIAELLKIESRDEKMEPEGVFWTRSEYNNKFISFDKHSLRRIPELLTKASASLKEGRNFNVINTEGNDLTLSFPMESGFPFIYTMKVPAMLKLSGSVKGENSRDFVNGSVDLRLVYSTQIQGRLGFVTPFDNQHYMAGVTRNFHACAPIRVEFNYQKIDKLNTLKLQLVRDKSTKILHYSVVPFISRNSNLNVMPIMSREETITVLNSVPRNREFTVGGIELTMEADSDLRLEPDDDAQYSNILKRAFDLFTKTNITYTKIEVLLSPTSLDDPSVILTTSFEAHHDDTTEYDKDRSESSLKASAPKISSVKLNDPKRRNALLMEAVKGMAAADGFAYDIGIEVNEPMAAEIVMTGAYGNSKIDEKSRFLIYRRFSMPEKRDHMESCLGVETASRTSSEHEISTPSRDFDIDLQFGETCEDGYNIQINGRQYQTEEYRDVLYQLPSVLECLNSKKLGIDSQYTCRDAFKMTNMDKSRLTMKFDRRIRLTQQQISSLVYSTILLRNGSVTFNIDKFIPDNILIFSLDLAPSGDFARLTFETGYLRSVLDDVEVGPLVSAVTNFRDPFTNRASSNLNPTEDSIYEHTCVLYNKSITTFDQKVYPIDVDECWHVAITTFPRTCNNTRIIEKIDEDMKLSILVENVWDFENGAKKDLRFILGNNEVRFNIMISNILVSINEHEILLNGKSRYRLENGEGLELEVLKRPDNSIWLSSPKYGIDAFISEKRVQIGLSDKYANKIRGLCGNYDFESDNDFTSPKNCVLMNPDEFAGSYALTSSRCRGPALENSKKAEAAVCLRKSGRIRNEDKEWKYFDETDSGDEL